MTILIIIININIEKRLVPKYARGVSRLTLHFYLKRYKFKMKFRHNNENHLSIEDKLDYSHEEFNSNMIKIIDDVIEERTKKHAEYLLLSKKVWYSNKKNKLTLGKYILGRLLRESDRIFFKAQALARKHCPRCKNQQNPKNYSISKTFH